MKRHVMIEKLTEIGRNGTRLQKLSNDELRDAMQRESAALGKQRSAKADRARVMADEARIRALISARRNRRREREAAYNREQFAAEQFRLHCISKPLIEIRRNTAPADMSRNTPSDRAEIRKLSRRLEHTLAQKTAQLRQSAATSEFGRALCVDINNIRGAIRGLELDLH